MYLGTLFIISAPSGAGKSSLIKAYLEQQNGIGSKVSVSHTTRAPRSGESHGEHYYFVDHHEFETLINQNAFVEHAKVFDNYYGTSKAAIEEDLKKGINLFLDIDWQGARQVKQQLPYVKSIFILPPSIAELENRLNKRGQDSQEVINKRMQKAKLEISHCYEYDYLLVNDDFSQTLQNLTTIIHAARLQTRKQLIENKEIIDGLIG